ncbi:2-oxoglutarate and iron-dependent oxygenase domain-containing protein 2 isoform X3 [Sceloporus undulatus]|uniref:2-oxoglutarate and iron-dependent oxygenase domain-containing protein 2 isoform X3 n=1 Tax=Sceloporus undulatus TaxID=8520 RepID=UPI001C4DB37F|nr:2-oxoglutarate and iron-dependent oxygenase domain-containing protein 2 isoform X3 [Sceloporus undulatus]
MLPKARPGPQRAKPGRQPGRSAFQEAPSAGKARLQREKRAPPKGRKAFLLSVCLSLYIYTCVCVCANTHRRLHALRQRGCRSEDEFKAVIQEIEKEVQRRKELSCRSRERKTIISQNYRPKHPQLYALQESFLAPQFLETVNYCTSKEADPQGLLTRVATISDKRIYRLPVFSKEFCQAFIEELENFEQSEMPKGRPNSMNNYGVLLNELGMDEAFITPLREKYLQPLTALLYPDCGGGHLDSHKAFVVKYALHEDLDLSSHYDNAEVTLNVSLGKEFTEGNLYFAEFRQDTNPVPKYIEVEHVLFHGLFHRGGQMHGALPVTSGERWNLIIWMRSSAVRNQLCPMCNREPELVEAEGFGDGFTSSLDGGQSDTVDVCALI